MFGISEILKSSERDTLYNAASIIKKECTARGVNCKGCPFCKENVQYPELWCKVGFPSKWEL